MHAYNSNLFTSMVNLMNLRKQKDPHVTLGQRFIPSSRILSVLRRASFLAKWSPWFCSKPPRAVFYFLGQNNKKVWLGFWSTKRGEKASQGHRFSYLSEARVSKPLSLLLLRFLGHSLSQIFYFFSFHSLTQSFLFSFLSLPFHGFSLKIL